MKLQPKVTNPFNLNAPILPLHSLGEIEIGANFSKYLSLDIDIHIESNGQYQNRYSYQNSIHIDVSIETGKIFKLIASNKYSGHLLNKIKIGCTVKDLFAATSFNGWDTDEHYIWNVELPGIFIGLDGLNKPSFYNTNDLERKILLIGMVTPNELGDYDIYGEEWFIKKNELLNKFSNTPEYDATNAPKP